MELAEAWIKEKDKVPTQIMQVGGCAFRDAQKLVRFYKKEFHEIQPTYGCHGEPKETVPWGPRAFFPTPFLGD